MHDVLHGNNQKICRYFGCAYVRVVHQSDFCQVSSRENERADKQSPFYRLVSFFEAAYLRYASSQKITTNGKFHKGAQFVNGPGDWRWGKREGYRAAVGVIGGGERGRDTELRWG